MRALAAGVDLLCVGNPVFPGGYDDEAALEEIVRGRRATPSATAASRSHRLEEASARVAACPARPHQPSPPARVPHLLADGGRGGGARPGRRRRRPARRRDAVVAWCPRPVTASRPDTRPPRSSPCSVGAAPAGATSRCRRLRGCREARAAAGTRWRSSSWSIRHAAPLARLRRRRARGRAPTPSSCTAGSPRPRTPASAPSTPTAPARPPPRAAADLLLGRHAA